MKREPHVRFCEGLGCNSLGLLTYGSSVHRSSFFKADIRIEAGVRPQQSASLRY